MFWNQIPCVRPTRLDKATCWLFNRYKELIEPTVSHFSNLIKIVSNSWPITILHSRYLSKRVREVSLLSAKQTFKSEIVCFEFLSQQVGVSARDHKTFILINSESDKLRFSLSTRYVLRNIKVMFTQTN